MQVVMIELKSEEDKIWYKEVLEPMLRRRQIKSGSAIYTLHDIREQKVTNVLENLGVKKRMKGFNYIREVVLACLEDETILHSKIPKVVYPIIAEKFEVSVKNMETNIRNTIKDTWENGNVEIWNKLFSYNYYKLDSLQFLIKIIEYIRLEEKQIK